MSSESEEMTNYRKVLLASAVVAGAVTALVLVFEWLSFLPLIFQYSLQFAILIGVGIALYYVFDKGNTAETGSHAT